MFFWTRSFSLVWLRLLWHCDWNCIPRVSPLNIFVSVRREWAFCQAPKDCIPFKHSAACWGGKWLGCRRNQFIFLWILTGSVRIIRVKVVDAEIRQLIPILWTGNLARGKEPARYTGSIAIHHRKAATFRDKSLRKTTKRKKAMNEYRNSNSNDPSAGLPTETLLRLLHHLDDRVQPVSQQANRLAVPLVSPGHPITVQCLHICRNVSQDRVNHLSPGWNPTNSFRSPT